MTQADNRLSRFFHPVLPVKKLRRRPVPVQIGDEKIVLYRNNQGGIVALEDRCPHRFTPLSAGSVNKAGRLACAYHGWSFNEAGEGLKPTQPEGARPSCRVQRYQVAERYGYIWVGNESADLGLIPDYSIGDFTFVASYSISFDAPLHVVLDNFSEDEHFPFIHKVFGWDETGVNAVEFSCKQLNDTIHVNYWGPQRSFFGMRFLFAKPGQYIENNFTIDFDPIRAIYTSRLTDEKRNHTSPGFNRAAINFVPIGENSTVLHVFQFVKFNSPFMYKILPIMKAGYVSLVKNDLGLDRKFIPHVRHVPYSVEGMALGQFDKPIVLGRRLMERVYFKRSTPRMVSPEEMGGRSASPSAGIPPRADAPAAGDEIAPATGT